MSEDIWSLMTGNCGQFCRKKFENTSIRKISPLGFQCYWQVFHEIVIFLNTNLTDFEVSLPSSWLWHIRMNIRMNITINTPFYKHHSNDFANNEERAGAAWRQWQWQLLACANKGLSHQCWKHEAQCHRFASVWWQQILNIIWNEHTLESWHSSANQCMCNSLCDAMVLLGYQFGHHTLCDMFGVKPSETFVLDMPGWVSSLVYSCAAASWTGVLYQVLPTNG